MGSGVSREDGDRRKRIPLASAARRGASPADHGGSPPEPRARRRPPGYAAGATDRSEAMPIVFHRGRLFDHVHLRVRDLEAAKRFYRAVLGALGHTPRDESPEYIAFDELWIDQADATGPSRVHIAFAARDQDAVRRFHQAGLAAGGRDNGAPGERHYHPGYFAAFVLDPDGHNVEAVYHGPGKWNVESVEITPL